MKYAALLLDKGQLDDLDALLVERRRIQRNASGDIDAKVELDAPRIQRSTS